MTSEGRGILSPVRLPVPPLQPGQNQPEYSSGSESVLRGRLATSRNPNASNARQQGSTFQTPIQC